MQDRDFFDLLYQQWSKTTHAEDAFWGYEVQPQGVWIFAQTQTDEHPISIGFTTNEADAAFITALHGCFGDLVRRWHAALDAEEESERRADEAVQDQFRLAVELAELKSKYEPRVEDWHGIATGS